MRLSSPTPETTAALAGALAECVDPSGLTLLLDGPLGAGKTHFVKGLAAGFGLPPEHVASPTFVLAQELPLPAGQTLVHVDCYRVEGEAELEEAGLLDWLAPGSLLVVEWAERVPTAWPDDRLSLRLGREGAGEGRRIGAGARGPRSTALLERWAARLRAAGWKAQ